MKTEIVVARYNENLDWLKKIKKSKDLKITVYNKGKDDIDVPFIQLPNIGRESHTYLYHIINNYDNLADQTIFCQGDSIFHSPDFLELINKHRKQFEPIQPLTAWYRPDSLESLYFSIPPKPFLEKTKNVWIKGCQIHVNYVDNDFVTRYPYFYHDEGSVKFININKELYNIDNMLKFNVERFRLKNINLNKLVPIFFSALFSVNKEVIRENSIDFYNNIMSILIYDVRSFKGINIDHGFALEKLWLLIFNYKKNNKNYIDLNVKDYLTYNYDLVIKNNIIKFKIFIIYCQIYLELYIDNKKYIIMLSRYIIFFKDSQILYKYDPFLNTSIQNALKDMSNVEINISLNNNILKIIGNNIVLIDYKFNKKVNKINNAKIIDLSNDNKLVDLLKK